MTLDEANAEAIRRIRAAKACGQWWLDLGDLPIERVPDEIAELSEQLRVLGLGDSKLAVTGDKWKWERDLDRPCSVRDLEPLKGLHNLTSLDLGGCGQLTALEPLRGLYNLTALDLSGCDQLPSVEIVGLTALTNLGLSSCARLRTVELVGLTALADLHFYMCWRLTSMKLFDLTALNTLEASYGQRLTTVELSGLTALTTLELYGCRQLKLSELLRGLPSLNSLHLCACQAESFSPVRDLLNRLERLYVWDASFPDLHPAVCGSSENDNALHSVRAYFAALKPDAKPDAEIKVFVLGNGQCGKSYLIRRLTGMTWEQIEAAKITTTHGVTIVTCPAPAEWGLPHPVTLSIWDFGGQDIYHGTHALFLREPAIYLLLYADATENDDSILDGGFEMHNRPLQYWFDYLRQEAGQRGVVKSPVLLIRSRSDEGLPEVPIPSPDAEAFPNISPLIRVSSKEPRGLRHLMPQLEDAIVGLLKEHPQPPLPASWAKVRERIREMQNAHSPRTMTLADLAALCDECGCNEGDAPILRDALTLMGVAYYRAGVFDDRIIVDQSWALDAIYTLFKRDHRRQRKIDEQHGRFTREDLSDYFWDEEKHSVADQRTFLSFMEQCGICFRANPGYDSEYEGHYIIPDKLKPLAEAETRRYENTLKSLRAVVEVTATFGLLHDGIARSFLSKIGSVAGDKATYWRYGCHFFDGNTNAESLIRTDGNTVRIQAWGEKAGELAQTLVKVLKGVPCGQPPTIMWADAADQPTVIEREDRDQKPESKLDPTFGPKSVFFSYRHPNRDAPGSERGRLLLRELQALLEPDGWTVRFDERELQDGDSISGFIDDVRRCGFLVPVFCGRYLDSRYTLSELFTFREKCAHDRQAFADRTTTVAYPESGIQNDLKQAESVRKCRTKFAEYFQAAGDGSLAPRVYEQAYHLKSWGERLSEVLADLNDRLNTPSAQAIADRLNRAFARLHPNR